MTQQTDMNDFFASLLKGMDEAAKIQDPSLKEESAKKTLEELKRNPNVHVVRINQEK